MTVPAKETSGFSDLDTRRIGEFGRSSDRTRWAKAAAAVYSYVEREMLPDTERETLIEVLGIREEVGFLDRHRAPVRGS